MQFIDIAQQTLQASILDFLNVNFGFNFSFLTNLFTSTTTAWVGGCQPGDYHGCPASSFTAIGAAFATQGYYMQADMIYMLTLTNFSYWAPFVYLIAAIGGLIGVAMGVPPRMYLWFFFGPALYNWLLYTTVPVLGVQWKVGAVPGDQRVVWRIAEPGLQNLAIKQRFPGLRFNTETGPSMAVGVSNLFLNYDILISDTVQWLIRYTGVFTLRPADQGQTNTTLPTGVQNMRVGETDRWYLMSNLKWSLLDSITSATLQSAELRDAFTTFLSSECGDAMSESIDKRAMIVAANAKSGRTPCSMFKGPSTGSLARNCSTTETGADYNAVTATLHSVEPIKIPDSIRELWREDQEGSFRSFYGISAAAAGGAPGVCQGAAGADRITPYIGTTGNERMWCEDLLSIIINGFRWEAGHIYYQIVSRTPAGMTDDDLIFHMIYGWNLHDDNGPLSPEQTREYIKNLILIYLFRNELELTKPILDPRYVPDAEKVQSGAESYVRSTGSKSKYAEVYTWALMVPYIQGVLLYFLAMAYPFACILIVAPGWHKVLITWMSFWAWVKLWDVGFAIVAVLERSIWAGLGNNSTMAFTSARMLPMFDWGATFVSPCSFESGGSCPIIPAVCNVGAAGDIQAAFPVWGRLIRLFDRAVMLAASIDLDLQNGYYIYIMSALYFAVPAVTGQLVLGAKAGAAGMISNMLSGASGDASRGASQGYTGDLQKKAQANAATVNQEAYAKAMKKDGIAAQAIQAGNKAMMAGVENQLLGARSSLLSNVASNLGKTNEVASAANQAQSAAARWELSEQMGRNSGVAGMLRAAGGGMMPTRSAPGTTGARGGRTARRVGGNMLNGGGSALEAYNSMWLNPQMQEVDARAAAAGYGFSRDLNDQLAGIAASQAALQVEQFNQGSAQAQHGMQERRLGSLAEFKAQTGAWAARRDLANSITGGLAAKGVDTGFLAPGNKPTDMTGMAMYGMLGGAAYSAAQFAADGGAFSRYQQSALGSIGNAPQTVASAYKPSDPAQLRTYAGLDSQHMSIPYKQEYGSYPFWSLHGAGQMGGMPRK